MRESSAMADREYPITGSGVIPDQTPDLALVGRVLPAGTYQWQLPARLAGRLEATLRLSAHTGTVPTASIFETMSNGVTEKMSTSGSAARGTFGIFVDGTQLTAVLSTLDGESYVILEIIVPAASTATFDQAQMTTTGTSSSSSGGGSGTADSTFAEQQAQTAALTAIDGHVDQLEGYVDGVEGKLDTLHSDVDQLEGYVDGVEGKLDTVHTDEAANLIKFTSIDGKLVAQVALDADSGAGTQLIEVHLLGLPKSGGVVAGGTSADPMLVSTPSSSGIWDGAAAGKIEEYLRYIATKVEASRVAIADTTAVSLIRDVRDLTMRECAMFYDLVASTSTTEALLSNGILYRDNVQISTGNSSYTIPATYAALLDFWGMFIETSSGYTTASSVKALLRALTQANPVLVGSPQIDRLALATGVAPSAALSPQRGIFTLPKRLVAGDSLGISAKPLLWTAATQNPSIGGVIMWREYQP